MTFDFKELVKAPRNEWLLPQLLERVVDMPTELPSRNFGHWATQLWRPRVRKPLQIHRSKPFFVIPVPDISPQAQTQFCEIISWNLVSMAREVALQMALVPLENKVWEGCLAAMDATDLALVALK